MQEKQQKSCLDYSQSNRPNDGASLGSDSFSWTTGYCVILTKIKQDATETLKHPSNGETNTLKN